MRTRLWEIVLAAASILYAVGFAAGGHLVRFGIAAAIFLWVARRVLPRYAVFWLFARRGLRRWRLGPRAVLDTLALGLRMNSVFRPAVAAKRLRHGRRECGWAYALFVPVVLEAATAHRALSRLSFYDSSDTLALAQSLESLRDLGTQLDRIDDSLVRSSGGAVRELLQVSADRLSGNQRSPWAAAAEAQSSLEGTCARRSGSDGEWFRRVIAKRGAVLNALRDGHSTMRRMGQRAVWMLERQRETGVGDEVELVDVATARSELREAAQLVSALTEGVGEAHLTPPARL